VPVPGIERGGRIARRGPTSCWVICYENSRGAGAPHSELGLGWHVTGDVVDIDDDGFVHILGRVKRFGKVRAEMTRSRSSRRLPWPRRRASSMRLLRGLDDGAARRSCSFTQTLR